MSLLHLAGLLKVSRTFDGSSRTEPAYVPVHRIVRIGTAGGDCSRIDLEGGDYLFAKETPAELAAAYEAKLAEIRAAFLRARQDYTVMMPFERGDLRLDATRDDPTPIKDLAALDNETA